MATDLYSTIEYSPGWYYKRWPGFYNEQCYLVLSDYSHNPDKYTKTEERLPSVEEGVEETKETDPSECAMCVTEPSDVHNNKKLKRSLSDT